MSLFDDFLCRERLKNSANKSFGYRKHFIKDAVIVFKADKIAETYRQRRRASRQIYKEPLNKGKVFPRRKIWKWNHKQDVSTVPTFLLAAVALFGKSNLAKPALRCVYSSF